MEGLYRELERVYDLDHAVAVINGDGADWIRKGREYFPRSIYQYDRFHISREVSRALKWDEDSKKEALTALRENSLGRLIGVLEKAGSKADKPPKASKPSGTRCSSSSTAPWGSTPAASGAVLRNTPRR